jgi:hypothetical protein
VTVAIKGLEHQLGTSGCTDLIGVFRSAQRHRQRQMARAIVGRIGRRWLPMGVSRSGHSSLWAAGLARTWGKGLRLVGVGEGEHAGMFSGRTQRGFRVAS